jgi:hypothetical protein
MPVAGWSDKAFRVLAARATSVASSGATSPVDIDCAWRGRSVRFREDADAIELRGRNGPLWSWRKSQDWARFHTPVATTERAMQ